MHINVEDVPGEEIAPGVVERVLMRPEEGVPPGFGARHYTLTDGGTVVFDEPMTEFQHYIISGHVVGAHQDTAIFVPAGNHSKAQQLLGKSIHRFRQCGEGETRIISLSHRVPSTAFRPAKSTSVYLFEITSPHAERWGATQLFREEEHAIMGALRMHGIDVQTHPGRFHHPKHRNPEGRLSEVMYFLRGTGEAIAEGERKPVRPGTFLYSGMRRGEHGGVHGIYNPTDDILQYFVVEIIEQDKSWTGRGFHTESLDRGYIFDQDIPEG